MPTDVVIDRLGALPAALRAQGTRVAVGELLTAHRVLCVVDCASREDARLALRTALCSHKDDLERFDRAFVAVFGDGLVPSPEDPLSELGEIERAALPRAGIPGTADRPTEPDPIAVPAAWSDVELLHTKDFAHYTDAEAALARAMIERLARRGPTRISRRTRPARRRGHTPDMRRVLPGSLRTGGEPVHRHWRAPSRRPPPLVLVCDVSGSMTPYARMLLQYLHACVAARRRVEAFEAEMARLRRSAHRLVWLNPLAAHPDYAPLTRGMRTAVPHTDELLAGNSLASLEQLAEILEGL